MYTEYFKKLHPVQRRVMLISYRTEFGCYQTEKSVLFNIAHKNKLGRKIYKDPIIECPLVAKLEIEKKGIHGRYKCL